MDLDKDTEGEEEQKEGKDHSESESGSDVGGEDLPERMEVMELGERDSESPTPSPEIISPFRTQRYQIQLATTSPLSRPDQGL